MEEQEFGSKNCRVLLGRDILAERMGFDDFLNLKAAFSSYWNWVRAIWPLLSGIGLFLRKIKPSFSSRMFRQEIIRFCCQILPWNYNNILQIFDKLMLYLSIIFSYNFPRISPSSTSKLARNYSSVKTKIAHKSNNYFDTTSNSSSNQNIIQNFQFPKEIQPRIWWKNFRNKLEFKRCQNSFVVSIEN